jgi:hypothetical protein
VYFFRGFFFFEAGAKKFYPNLLIKKKRIAQLIYKKPGENQYKHTTHKESKHHTRTCRLPNSPDTTQLLPLTLEQSNEALIRRPNAYHGSHITIQTTKTSRERLSIKEPHASFSEG